MAIIFSEKVYDAGITGTTPVYTPPDLYRRIAQGEKFFVQVRASQPTGTPSLKVDLEHSNEGIATAAWFIKQVLIAPTSVASTSAPTYLVGFDLGAAVIGGSFMRLAMTLSGATPGCYVEVWLTVRSND